MHSMWQYENVSYDERLWKFTWNDAVRAETIAMDLKDCGLDFEVIQGYAVRNRDWTYSATVVFEGTAPQAEALFNAILAKPWAIQRIRVEAHDIEAVRVRV